MPKTAVKEDLRTARKRIYLVDDHAVVRSGLAELLNQTDPFTVCGGSATAEEALQQIPRAKPDLVLVDLALERTSGLDLVKDLKIRMPQLPVLVLSMHDEAIYAERCLRAGAKGYVMKHEAIDELRAAIRKVLEGGIAVSPRMADRLLHSFAQGGDRSESLEDRLSDRELEVYDLIGQGLGASEIARKLRLSVKTIETYQAKLKEKLGLKDSSELFRHALRWVERRKS